MPASLRAIQSDITKLRVDAHRQRREFLIAWGGECRISFDLRFGSLKLARGRV